MKMKKQLNENTDFAREYIIRTIMSDLEYYSSLEDAYSVKEALQHEFAGDYSSAHLDRQDIRDLDDTLEDMCFNGELEPDELNSL